MKNKIILIVSALALLLAGGGGAYWWFVLRNQHPAPVALVNTSLALPTFTLSASKPGGMTSYLVIGLAAEIKGPSALDNDWIKTHDLQLRAAILSSLLGMKDIRDANTNKAVRAVIRNEVTVDMNRLLRSKKSGFHTAHVYITKLILQ